VKYASPSFAGFSLGGMYAFSNEAGAFANNRAYGIGANYQGGAISAGAAWLHANGRGNTPGGAYDPVVLPGSNRDVFDANVQTQNIYAVGASYTIGDFLVGVAWLRSTYSDVVNADSGDAVPAVGFSNYEINGIYQLTPAVSLAGMYAYTKGSSAHWHQGAVQMAYALSKRTDTYVEAVYQRASSGAPAVINTNDPSSSSNQLLIGAGIRHHF
jgi:general bacterial porin, GBP family